MTKRSKRILSNLFFNVATVVMILLAIDCIGFLVWGLSGQFPVDNFYIGSITKHVLQAVLF